jgi:hypothetical protein
MRTSRRVQSQPNARHGSLLDSVRTRIPIQVGLRIPRIEAVHVHFLSLRPHLPGHHTCVSVESHLRVGVRHVRVLPSSRLPCPILHFPQILLDELLNPILRNLVPVLKLLTILVGKPLRFTPSTCQRQQSTYINDIDDVKKNSHVRRRSSIYPESAQTGRYVDDASTCRGWAKQREDGCGHALHTIVVCIKNVCVGLTTRYGCVVHLLLPQITHINQ